MSKNLDPGAAVAERLHAVMHRMKRRLHQAARVDADGLSPMEARALAFFARHPGSTASDLVEHSGRDKAQIARLIRLLIDRELLGATPAPHDQRSLQLTLTDNGRKVERKMAAQRRRVELDLLAGFSEAELREIAAYLDRMAAALGDAG